MSERDVVHDRGSRSVEAERDVVVADRNVGMCPLKRSPDRKITPDSDGKTDNGGVRSGHRQECFDLAAGKHKGYIRCRDTSNSSNDAPEVGLIARPVPTNRVGIEPILIFSPSLRASIVDQASADETGSPRRFQGTMGIGRRRNSGNITVHRPVVCPGRGAERGSLGNQPEGYPPEANAAVSPGVSESGMAPRLP